MNQLTLDDDNDAATQYEEIIEYTPSEIRDEEAMLEAEHKVFNKIANHVRNKTLMISVSTTCKKDIKEDTAVAVCTVGLVEVKA